LIYGAGGELERGVYLNPANSLQGFVCNFWLAVKTARGSAAKSLFPKLDGARRFH
jgi:hypothetical protein